MDKLAQRAKAVAALVIIAAGEALTYGLVPERYRGWAQVIVAVGVAAGVHQVPNAPKLTSPDARRRSVAP